MKKKLISLTLVLILVLGVLAACGGADPGAKRKASNSAKENALRLANNLELNTLDIHHYTLASESRIYSLIYDRLMNNNNEAGEWEPWICTKMEPNEDGTVVNCEIRDDVYFSSGDKLEMEDILYSLERTQISNKTQYLYENSYIEPVDATHFTWYFPNEGYSYYSLQEYANGLYVFNKSFCEQYISDPCDDLLFHVDGTGAYKLESEIHAGTVDVTLVKNDKYWNTCSIDKIIYKYVSGDQEIAFESGDIDFFECSKTNADKLESYSNVTTIINYPGYINCILLNCSENSVFNDIRLREAFQYGFDREEVGMAACDFVGTVAWTIMTPGAKNWADVVPHRTLDEEKAKKMMSELGYSESNPCRITILTIPIEGYVPAAEALKENLDKVYFECEIAEVTEVTRYFNGDFDAGVIGFGMNNDFNAFGEFFTESSGLDLAMYYDEDLAAEILQANDPESAKQALLDMDATMAYIPISYPARFYAYDSKLDPGPYSEGYDWRQAKWIK